MDLTGNLAAWFEAYVEEVQDYDTACEAIQRYKLC